MRVRMEPFEKMPDDQGAFADLTADLNSYTNQFAAITVSYDLLDVDGYPYLPDVAPGILLSYHMDFSGETLAVPGVGLQWQSSSTAPVSPDSVPALRVPIVEHHVTWRRVLDPPWDAIRACTGTVNSATFLGAAAATLLFEGAKVDREFTGLDDLQQPQYGWRVSYLFREKAIKVLVASDDTNTYGWNHSYRDAPYPYSGWDQLQDPSGNTLYQTADFTTLFAFTD